MRGLAAFLAFTLMMILEAALIYGAIKGEENPCKANTLRTPRSCSLTR